jgi:hypothetical protein
MIPKSLCPNSLTSQNRAVLLKIGLTPTTGFAMLETYLFTYASFIEENTSEFNLTHSSTITGKLINISIPAILWSYDTISVLTSFASQKNYLL